MKFRVIPYSPGYVIDFKRDETKSSWERLTEPYLTDKVEMCDINFPRVFSTEQEAMDYAKTLDLPTVDAYLSDQLDRYESHVERLRRGKI